MKRAAGLVLFAAATLPLTGLGQSQDTAIKIIQEDQAQWSRDYAARDPEKIASHYADDAVIMNPHMPPISGMANLRRFFAMLRDYPDFSLSFTCTKAEVAASGDLAYARGTYVETDSDPSTKKIIHDHGSYVTVYRKQPSGAWKAVEDIATSEVPRSREGEK